MERRNFIAGLSAMALIGTLPAMSQNKTNSGIIKPKVLHPGDTVGIIAPATAVSDPDDMASAKEALNYFGLKMKFGQSVAKGSGYKTRTIEERVKDLHDLFTDSSISAIFCIRGGYGTPEILNHINYDLIGKNPKIFLGYSDITALHLAIHKMTGLVTFHGPVLLSDFSQYSVQQLQKAIFSTEPLGVISNPTTKNSFRLVHPVRTIKPGKASGKLNGGNLSLVSALMGTPYEIETKNKILFLEDVGEEPYRIDRMLTQLKLAGKLQSAAGVVFGECKSCSTNKLDPSLVWDYSLGEVIDNIFQDINIPVFYGLTIGHTSDQATLPIGVEAELDAQNCYLNVLESGVV